MPTPQDMYPPGYQTWVTVEDVTQPLEGAMRPGHFRGVATVVAKLFNAVQPQKAYFGQKDAQQVAVIRQMVSDLNFPLEIVVCPTRREADGLAMSSRNAYLSPEERRAATVLYRALNAAKSAFARGRKRCREIAPGDGGSDQERAAGAFAICVVRRSWQPGGAGRHGEPGFTINGGVHR